MQMMPPSLPPAMVAPTTDTATLRQHAESLRAAEQAFSDEAQKIYAAANNEYPVSPRVAPSAIVASWGTLKADPLPLENIAKYRKRASELVDKVNFDAGPSS